jgi:hypothetical protein
LVRIPDFDPIDYLLERKFPGSILAWPRGYGEGQSGRPLPDPEKVEIYRNQLLEMSDAELNALVAQEKDTEQREAAKRAEFEENQRFFNRPEAVADFDFWSRASYWTIDEALALSLGKNPRLVNWEKLAPFVQISKFAAEFEGRRMLAQRAQSMAQLADTNIPGFFLAWAARTGLSVPKALLAAVNARGVQIADWKSLYDEAVARIAALEKERGAGEAQPSPEPVDSLRARERETLLKLIIGMAIRGYGHNPSADRTGTAREIAGDLEKNGIGLDEDTVRKWLKRAREVLPGDWKPDNKD